MFNELPRALLSLVVDTKLISLQLKVAAGWSSDCGIVRHEGVPYVWEIKWTKAGNNIDFLLEVFKLIPKTRGNGKVRKDRAPSLALIASHQFESEVEL